jgi:hypothetical protein
MNPKRFQDQEVKKTMVSVIFPQEKIKGYGLMVLAGVAMFFAILLMAGFAALLGLGAAPISSVSVLGHETYNNPNGIENVNRAINSITWDYVTSMLALFFLFAFDFMSGAFLSDRLVKSFGFEESSDLGAGIFFFLAFLWWLPVAMIWTWIFPGSIKSIFDPFILFTGFILVVMALDIILSMEIRSTGQTELKEGEKIMA